MTIHFYHNSNQEMINGITNPIGTLLITFINETNFDSKLLNQKDTNFMYRVYLAYCQLFVDDIMEIINQKNTKELSNQKLPLTITFDDNKTIDFTLSYSEFEQLVSLVTYIKLFIELNIKKKSNYTIEELVELYKKYETKENDWGSKDWSMTPGELLLFEWSRSGDWGVAGHRPAM